MRVWFVVLSLLLIALAGCTDSGDSDTGNGETGNGGSGETGNGGSGETGNGGSGETGNGGSGETGGSQTGGTGSGNVTGGPLNQTLPQATLLVTVPEGFAPVDVVFNMSISGFPDEQFVDWTLDVDGDGELDSSGFGGLPFDYAQTITKGGNYTATFTAEDGEAYAEVSVNFTIAEEPKVPPIVIEGEVAAPCGTIEGCYVIGMEGCIGFWLDSNGLDCYWAELPEEAIGFGYSTSSSGDVDVEFRDGCSSTSSSIALNGGEGHDSGTVPAGAKCVYMADYTSSGMLTMTIQQ